MSGLHDVTTGNSYTPIACHLYDSIEAACVLRYELKVTFRNYTSCTGVAEDITSKHKQEFLILRTVDGNEAIRLDCIARMEVITRPSVFDQIDFDTP